MRIKIFLLSLFIFGILSSFPTRSFSQTDDRADLISKELDCVSAHEQKGDVNWSDVCYSSSNNREQKIAKAMDQIIQEHQAMADDMLSENTDDNSQKKIKSIDQDQAVDQSLNETKSVDDVYRQQTDYYENNSDDQSTGQDQEGDQRLYPSIQDNDSNMGGDIEDPYDSKKHIFDFGREDFYYRYNEDIPIVNRGWMHGYYGNYTYRPDEGNLLNNEILNTYSLETRYARGDLDYKGSGIDNDRTNKSYEIRALLGKEYLLEDRSKVTPYVGIGYRYLMDRGGGRLTTTNHYGYNRESQYYYLPIGVTANIPAPHDWNVGLNIEYDFFWQGVQKSRLSDGDQFNGLGNDDLRNHQDKGFGLRGSIKFLKKSHLFDMYVEPFIRYWNIDQSKVQSGMVDGASIDGVEPKNNTTEIGSKIGLQF